MTTKIVKISFRKGTNPAGYNYWTAEYKDKLLILFERIPGREFMYGYNSRYVGVTNTVEEAKKLALRSAKENTAESYGAVRKDGTVWEGF